jgi:hypothetical protein
MMVMLVTFAGVFFVFTTGSQRTLVCFGIRDVLLKLRLGNLGDLLELKDRGWVERVLPRRRHPFNRNLSGLLRPLRTGCVLEAAGRGVFSCRSMGNTSTQW